MSGFPAGVIGFPNPVNEKAARTVAGAVLVLGLTSLVLSLTAGSAWLWIVAALAVGFVLRVLSGPRLSPLGLLATRVVAPRLGPATLVAGPPKRFAQAVGAAFTITATVLLATGHPLGTQILLGLLIVAAGLESIFAFCLGCQVFALLMRAGMIPEETCEACANIALRSAA